MSKYCYKHISSSCSCDPFIFISDESSDLKSQSKDRVRRLDKKIPGIVFMEYDFSSVVENILNKSTL